MCFWRLITKGKASGWPSSASLWRWFPGRKDVCFNWTGCLERKVEVLQVEQFCWGVWGCFNISTAQGGGGSFQRYGTYRKGACGVQLVRKSIDVRFKRFWLSIDLRFNWFGCQLIWDSNDLVVNRCVLQMILVVCWFELQVMWLSIDVRFKWFGCQLIWDSSDLDVKWFEVQVIWLSTDVWFKWFCQTKLFCETSFKNDALKVKNEAFLRDFRQKWNVEDQKRNISARLPSKMKLWSSKTQFLCETSFKNECFEDQKRSISARLPSKMTLWRSKTKHFCETSVKKWNVQDQKRSISARLPSKLTCRPDTWPPNCNTHVLTIFKWMLQKYCACHQKIEPRHTKSCNCHAKWSLKSNTSVTWNLQPFHGFCVGSFKHRHHKARNPCACYAKRIISEPLQIHHACQRFCNPHELLRLPRILQRVEIPAPATRKALSTSKNVPRPSVFNDFDFQIALARRRGANFAKLNFQKCSEHAAWCLFFAEIALARRRGANFVDILGSRSFATPVFRSYLCEPSKRQNYGKTQHFAQFLPAKISQVSHPRCQTSLLRDLPATFSIVGS